MDRPDPGQPGAAVGVVPARGSRSCARRDRRRAARLVDPGRPAPLAGCRSRLLGTCWGMAQSARRRRRIVLGLVAVLLVGLAVGMLTALQRQLIYFPDST